MRLTENSRKSTTTADTVRLFGILLVSVLAALICLVPSGTVQADRGDVTADGGADLAALTKWVFDEGSGSYYLPGDANGDGKVDGGDLSVWQMNYSPVGSPGITLEMGDWNMDSKVDGADLAIWQMNYDPVGSEPPFEDPPAHAPEPLTVIGLVMGLGGLGTYLRRRSRN